MAVFFSFLRVENKEHDLSLFCHLDFETVGSNLGNVAADTLQNFHFPLGNIYLFIIQSRRVYAGKVLFGIFSSLYRHLVCVCTQLTPGPQGAVSKFVPLLPKCQDLLPERPRRTGCTLGNPLAGGDGTEAVDPTPQHCTATCTRTRSEWARLPVQGSQL